jgi:serine/threonine protein kinase
VVLDYRLERELGKGGMGSVWLAHHKVSEQAVAVKILPAGLARDREVRERFLQEAKALAKLDHPCIVPLVTFSSKGDEHFLVMKYVDGESVQARIDRAKKLSFDDVRSITRDVLGALGYAHKRGVIHRDIKPGNVLVAKDGRTFLADFGIAKQEAGAKLTQTGMLMGTPQYMAPEQIQGGAVTPRTDLYGMGLLVYEMITGSPPFDFGKTFAILKAHLESQVPHPERRRGERIPEDLVTLMRSLLQKDPDNRVDSTDAALAILDDPSSLGPVRSPFDEFEEMTIPPTSADEREFFTESDEGPVVEDDDEPRKTNTPVTQAPPSSGPLPTLAEKSSRVPLVIAAMLAILLVGGLMGGGWFLTRPPPPEPDAPDPPALVEAKEHIVYGRYSQARDALKALIDSGDANTEARLLLVRAEIGRGKLDEAEAALAFVGTKLDDDQRRRLAAMEQQLKDAKAAAPKPSPGPTTDKPKPDKKPTRRTRRTKPKPTPKPVAVKDDLSDADLRAGVSQTDVAVRNCFQENLSEDERAKPAEVRFSVEIKGDGSVRRAKFIRKTAGDAGLARCLSKVARSWRFPAFKADRILFDHTFAYRPPN